MWLMALVGGDGRIVAVHDRAVARTLAWVERDAIETRCRTRPAGAMVHAGGQKMVAATFRTAPRGTSTRSLLAVEAHRDPVPKRSVAAPDGLTIGRRICPFSVRVS